MVLFAGPPFVRFMDSSNSCKVPLMDIINVMIMVGFRSGTVIFQQSIANTFLYLITQVPIMLVLAILLAQLLNNRDLKFKGFFRTCVFLPCATSLVSYSLIFRSMFAIDCWNTLSARIRL